ncbi:MAG: SGNH/GDSL hydrolase family protein [Opitutaceae bacterium]|jgi:lysophospholipase L1-like esterase
MKRKLTSIFCLFLTCACLRAGDAATAAPTTSSSLFRDGDRWMAVGDSITEGGTYYAWVYLYYATRFPGIDLKVMNGGVGGDSLYKVLLRYDWDIAPRHPSVATVMLGMNDVQRQFYVADATPKMIADREAAIDAYGERLRVLAKRIHDEGTRLIFLTPSPFDDTADIVSDRFTGVNGALARCADLVREVAAENGDPVVDLHGPMTALTARLQAADPAATIIGPDRTHPREAGNFVMAYHILKAQGASAIVSDITIDAGADRVTGAVNAKIDQLRTTTSSVEFTLLESALPYPLHKSVMPALAWVPFNQDFNREILRVTGLGSGLYRLEIDGVRIRDYQADELTAGVDLAAETATPQTRQATQVLALVRSWQDMISQRDRAIASIEHRHLRDWSRPIDYAKAKSFLEEKLSASPPPPAWDQRKMQAYIELKPRAEEVAAEIAATEGKIREAAKPRPHVYRLIRL